MNWGIPLSLMTFFGNLLFTPLLTIFLMISSLVFITELFSLPNEILISILDLITRLWEQLLLLGKKSWLIGVATPSFPIALIAIALISLLVGCLILKISSKILLITISIMLVPICWHYHQWPEKSVPEAVPGTNETLFVLQLPNKKITIIDHGCFNKKQSPGKYVSFELRPYLMKKYGTRTIEALYLKKPSARSFMAVKELAAMTTIENVILAEQKKPLSRYGIKKYKALTERLEAEGTVFQNKSFTTSRANFPSKQIL